MVKYGSVPVPAPRIPSAPAWLFIVTGIPYGVGGSFGGAVMPYLARRAGIELDAIGWFGTLVLVPPMLQFLYAPIVDVGLARRHWLILVSVLGALCFFGACLMPLPSGIVPFLALAVAGQLIGGLSGSCNGGLLATLIPDHLRGRASACLNIGNLSGGGLSAWLVIWMTGQNFSPLVIATLLAAMMILPSLAVLIVVEPPRDASRRIADVFRSMLTDVRKIVLSRSGATGILLCLSPVGTAALANYFSGMAVDYGASDALTAFVSGPANVVLTAVGALAGGFLCDRYNRRLLYLLSGLLTALCGIAMVLSPRSDMTYLWGVTTYALITGFCYSAFTATVLETVGKGGEAASTKYALFVAAGNAAIAYVGLADTRFHDRYGVEGVVGSDAGLNILGVVVLGGIFAYLGYFKSLRHTPEMPPGPAAAAPPAELPTARVVRTPD